MRPWLIFGAGGSGTGAKVLELALVERRPLLAVVRNPQSAVALEAKGVRVFAGDACDADVVADACHAAGADALIVSSMGGAEDYLAHRTVIDAAEAAGIGQMILVTSLGCGDSWPFLSPRAKAAFGQAVREKTLAESGCKPAAWIMPSCAPAACSTARRAVKRSACRTRSATVS